jgi:hypothetical protein
MAQTAALEAEEQLEGLALVAEALLVMGTMPQTVAQVP